jgi:T-complex protein 1 subunit beta
MASFNPTQIFDDGTTEEKGENARLSAFVGAIAVGDLGMGSFHLIRINS